MNDHIRIAYAMKRWGGSFINGIGEALLHADSSNVAKVKATWPDEWEKYRAMAIKYEAQQKTEAETLP